MNEIEAAEIEFLDNQFFMTGFQVKTI